MEYIDPTANDEEILFIPENFLEDRKKSIRKSSWWSIGIGLIVILAHVALILFLKSANPEQDADYSIIFRSIFFIFASVAVVGGIWGFYEAKHLKLEDITLKVKDVEKLQLMEESKPVITYIFIGLIVAVFIISQITAQNTAIQIGGLVKSKVWQGELWRIITAGTIHLSFIHVIFNSQALLGLGKKIEFLTNRYHLPISFVLSVIGGSIFSILLMPDTNSAGASGGVMGLLGFLGVYGYFNKPDLPPNFFKDILVSIGFIAVFGVIGYQFIDNAAHLGGLITGAVYGYFQFVKNHQKTGQTTKILGFAAIVIFTVACIFTIFLLTRLPN
jgi:membrane associated rhomboid family serine protease